MEHARGAPEAQHRTWLLLAALACALAVVQVADLALTDRRMVDLAVYQWGGDLAWRGDRLYDATFEGHLPFTYTPFAAVAFLPLALLPFGALEVLSLGVGITCLVLVIWLVAGASGAVPRCWRAAFTLAGAALALQLEPVRETLAYGQINLVLLALVVGDLCLPDRSRWKGVGVGVATGLKLTPAIFIVYLLCTRRVPAAIRAGLAAAATVAIGFAVLPAASGRFWFGALFLDAERVGGIAYVANQSINGALIRWAGDPAGVEALWWLVAVLVGVAGLALAAWLARRGDDLAGVVTCALTGLVVSPVSWSHHWVWVVPALVVGVAVARRRAVLWVAVALGALVFLGTPARGLIWWAPHADDRELSWTLAESAVGDAYVVAALAALAALAVVGARAARHSVMPKRSRP